MTALRPLLAPLGLAALVLALLATASLHAEPTDAPAETTDSALPIEADWTTRASAWFTAADEDGRRKEMRAMTRALRQPCRYCHTPDFTGYTAKQRVAQQMMALSAEHGVSCDECHAGKTELTPFGQKAAPMWALARDKKLFCGACHVKHRRFEELNETGKAFRAKEWKAWKAAHPAPAPAPAAPVEPK